MLIPRPAQALLGPGGNIQQYRSLADLLDGHHQQTQSLTGVPKCQQVVAYDAGFAALTVTGDVYSWGDERYAACLGRDVSAEDVPADQPALVTALQDLPTGPISKIAAGGYMLAALTSGNDLYLWGGHPGRKAIVADVADEPMPMDIDGRDIADVAIGESHLVVLTVDGDVFVIGDNTNGQLGLPDRSVVSWTQVKLDLQGGRRAVGVAAGPKSTLIIVQEKAT
ncbi:hypothetical protein VMCG_04358 [Cytospora schulzeri]|uniref:Regulator of chromosome condensation 1/beta-lactamase-inhibitor protein II n=1 Tax=Cytospora schulzeri TaxID=448051 RepID=A0A423WSL8_9PEZI|nr:hypothetical protein VMCG_04358 [Valsa malicola]